MRTTGRSPFESLSAVPGSITTIASTWCAASSASSSASGAAASGFAVIGAESSAVAAYGGANCPSGPNSGGYAHIWWAAPPAPPATGVRSGSAAGRCFAPTTPTTNFFSFSAVTNSTPTPTNSGYMRTGSPRMRNSVRRSRNWSRTSRAAIKRTTDQRMERPGAETAVGVL